MDRLRRQIRRAQWLLGLGRCLGALGWCCGTTLTVALVLIVLDRFRPLGVEPWMWAVGAIGLGLLTAVCWAWLERSGPLDAAIEIDRRFGLKERVSSVLAMSDEESGSEVGQALVDDAVRRATRIDLGDRFRVRPGRQIFLPLIPGGLSILVVLFVSPAVFDDPADAATREAVTKQVKTSAEKLRRKLDEQQRKAEEKGLEDAQDLFERLQQGTEELASKPEADRKQALVELNDLKRQIDRRRDDLAGAQRMRDQFNQLRDIDRGPADRLLEEIRRGNFDKALEQLDKLKAGLAKNDLTDEEKRQLADQLEQMKRKLEDMAKAHGEAVEDLQRRVQQARLEGRDDEANQLEDMLDALRRQAPQMNQLGGMANKMGQCAQSLRDGQLQDAGDLLSQLQDGFGDLQSQLDELGLLDEAMGQVSQCRNRMNCPLCAGAGCANCGKEPGRGLGEGRGRGDRPEAEDGVGLYDAKSPVNVQKGEATVVGNAGWAAVKGNVQEQIQEQYESAKRTSSDPLTGLRLPRRMREGVQQYFDDFRQGE